MKEINPGVEASLTGNGVKAMGSKILFSADDGIHGHEPWVNDGTVDDTFMLTDILVAQDPTGPCGAFSAPVGSLVFNSSLCLD